jgi:hypothetical protein
VEEEPEARKKRIGSFFMWIRKYAAYPIQSLRFISPTDLDIKISIAGQEFTIKMDVDIITGTADFSVYASKRANRALDLNLNPPYQILTFQGPVNIETSKFSERNVSILKFMKAYAQVYGTLWKKLSTWVQSNLGSYKESRDEMLTTLAVPATTALAKGSILKQKLDYILGDIATVEGSKIRLRDKGSRRTVEDILKALNIHHKFTIL